MPRVLTVSRVTVPPQHEAEYLRTIHALAELGGGRRQQLWVFRSRRTPHSFVEFSESPSELSHRARASRTDQEQKLERRLHEIATYAADAWDLWEEVPAPAAEAADGWTDAEES
jgi:hypothetical protein